MRLRAQLLLGFLSLAVVMPVMGGYSIFSLYRLKLTTEDLYNGPLMAINFARSAQFNISQKKRRFDPKLLNAKTGDTVLFVNDDRYAHTLYSKTPGFEFNVRKQMPGDEDTIKLDKRGKFEVRCAIHPRMKMTINVE